MLLNFKNKAYLKMLTSTMSQIVMRKSIFSQGLMVLNLRFFDRPTVCVHYHSNVKPQTTQRKKKKKRKKGEKEGKKEKKEEKKEREHYMPTLHANISIASERSERAQNFSAHIL